MLAGSDVCLGSTIAIGAYSLLGLLGHGLRSGRKLSLSSVMSLSVKMLETVN